LRQGSGAIAASGKLSALAFDRSQPPFAKGAVLGQEETGDLHPAAAPVALQGINPIETPELGEVPRGMVRRPGDHFAPRVRGNSMAEAGIRDGDLVVVRRPSTAEGGETVVALVDGLATVKRLHREGERVWLVPANEALEPMEVTSHAVATRGVEVGVVRFL